MEKTRLVSDLDINVPFDKISVKMLKGMKYGEDIKLDDNFTISKHSEEDMIDIYHTETSSKVYVQFWYNLTETILKMN